MSCLPVDNFQYQMINFLKYLKYERKYTTNRILIEMKE